jgi:hypothetical protein
MRCMLDWRHASVVNSLPGMGEQTGKSLERATLELVLA